MKYERKASLAIVFLIACYLIYKINQNITIYTFYNEDSLIEILEQKINLYDCNGKVVDSRKLKQKILDYAFLNLDDDNFDELAILTRRPMHRFGKEIIIFKLNKEIVEMYRKDFSELKPWKLAKGDIDGDGRDELSIGVYKKTPFHQVMAKRPFIYYYEDERLIPKWRGSRLSMPFDDYCFYDIDRDKIDELISIEVLQNGEKILDTYKWRGFGFEGLLRSKSFNDIRDMRVESNSVLVKIVEKGEDYIGEIMVQDDTLIIERVNSE